ncbi:MAG: hypothetical protein E7182_00245 [Erysipelotrichaceae bacterium]|jgi:hypothetical protein|nr:hypothetical protein [Erysipelotrichaceae bacterium]
MKKNLILLSASAMLLAGCGGSANSGYVAEPSGGKVVEATVLAEAAKKLSGNLPAKKAIGMKLDGSGKVDGSLSFRSSAELGPLSGKAYKVNLEANMNGNAGLGSFEQSAKGSASASASLKGNLVLPAITGVDSETMSFKVEDKTVNLDASLNAKAYLEEGTVYADLTGLKDGVTKFYNAILPVIGGGIGLVEQPEIPDVFKKFKLALPEEFVATLGQLPESLQELAGKVAEFLGSFEELKSEAASGEAKKLLEGIEFKTYDGGLFGIHVAADLKDIVSFIPAEQTEALSVINKVLEKVGASAEALLLFSETEVRSAGFTVKVDVKDLDFASFVEGEAQAQMPFDKLNLSFEAGEKIEFSYDNAVQIETLADKTGYEELPTDALPDLDEE